jgi:hypothetical protein
MGDEPFDEVILVANDGTVWVRGGWGRKEVYLGLARGRRRAGDPDISIELGPIQHVRLIEALKEMLPKKPKKRGTR